MSGSRFRGWTVCALVAAFGFCVGAFAAEPVVVEKPPAAVAAPANPAAAEKPVKPAEKIAPSDHPPRIGEDGRAAVMAFRQKNYIAADMKVGDGYVDGGHAMKFQKNDGVSSSREILAVDRTRDAALQKELAYAHSAELAQLNPLDRATRLARHVAQLYTPQDGRKDLVEKTAVLETVHRNHEVLIGDVAAITGGAGVCRHRSLMYKLLADEAGLKVSLVRGLYGHDPAKAGYHAWNELHLDDGRMVIVDTTNPQPDFHFPELTSRQAPRYLNTDRKPMYSQPAAADEKPAPAPKSAAK